MLPVVSVYSNVVIYRVGAVAAESFIIIKKEIVAISVGKDTKKIHICKKCVKKKRCYACWRESCDVSGTTSLCAGSIGMMNQEQ